MFNKKILDEIEQAKGYDIALLTTFNFEVSFFEKQIVNTLYDNNVKKINIFVDEKELSKSIENVQSNYIGKKYIISPIEMQSSFHPKILLLLGEDKAKLIVSSANVTISGYMINNEIYNVFEYNSENPENLKVIIMAYNFFKKLQEISFYKDDEIFHEIRNYIYLQKEAEFHTTFFLENTTEAIFKQLKNIIKEPVQQIDIAVPYYDNELSALKMICREYPNSKIILYLQNEKSTFPVKYNEINNIISKGSINIFNVLISNNSSNFYHGKVFRFNTENISYILYGSTNCTSSALMKSFQDNGNIECDILEFGQLNDFNYFFDNFKINNNQELKTNIMEFEDKNDMKESNYHFKYGILEEDLTLYINYHKKLNIIEISAENNLLEYNYFDNYLVVKVSQEVLMQLENIFEVSIKLKDKSERLKCWYIDTYMIKNYRYDSQKKLNIDDINIDDNNDDINKYRQHMDLLLRTLSLNKEECKEQEKINKLFLKTEAVENDDSENEEELDMSFIVDNDIPDEYIKKNRNLLVAQMKSKAFANRFYANFTLQHHSKIDQSKTKDMSPMNHTSDVKAKKRLATPAEKRFERFVKSRVKEILNKEYVEIVDYSHYKNIIGVILDIINQFKYKYKIENVFNDKYVIDISFTLLDRLISKDIGQSTEVDKENTIILSLMIILQNHNINRKMENKDYKIEVTNKRFIKLLDRLYNIRENFKKYLEISISLISKNYENLTNEMNEEKLLLATQYIDNLFGYKTPIQLISMLKKYYGKECIISFENNSLYIRTVVEDIAKYVSKESLELKDLLKQLNNYSKSRNNKLEELVVDIIKKDKTKNLIRIEYKINIETGKSTRKLSYANNPSSLEEEYQVIYK